MSHLRHKPGRIPVGLIVLTVLAVALIVGYYQATETVRYVASPGPAAKVRHNPFYAAEALLEQWHRPSRRVFSTRALFPLPGPDTTLIMDGQRGRLGADRIRELLGWVRTGGHLIIVPLPDPPPRADTSHRDGPLLRALGIAVTEPADNAAPHSTGNGHHEAQFKHLLNRFQPMETLFQRYCLDNPSGERLARCEALTCQAPAQPTPAVFRDLDHTVRRLQPLDDRVLHHQPVKGKTLTVLTHAISPQGQKLIQLGDGNGRVTVLTDLSIWDNRHLHYFDHAWLLHRLTGNGPVWFVQGISMPPLPVWLWEHAWPLILALATALIFWLWRQLPRPGPIWATPDGERADYLGHLRALGHFLWRLDQAETLLAPLREQARHRLALLHPDAQRARALAAERLALSADDIGQALEAGPPTRNQPALFIRRVALLQRITRLHQ